MEPLITTTFSQCSDILDLLTIGRRIEFDYEKFGHSPSCLGSNTNIVNGKTAVVQGYGRAEDGKNSHNSLAKHWYIK